VRYESFGNVAADLVFSASGELLAAAAPFVFSGSIAVWDVGEPAEPTLRLDLTDPGVDRRASLDSMVPGWLRFSPDSSRLYAGGAGPTVAFDLGTGEPVREFDGDGALALSPDGQSIAILTTLTNVGVFDTADGRRRSELVGHDGLVTAAAFSPDGATVATVSNDETVAVWDVETGERLHLLKGHVGSVLGVDFAGDGTTLYTSAADASIIIWDLGGAAGGARQVIASTSPVGSTGAVWLGPSPGSVGVPGSAAVIRVDGADRIDRLDDASGIAWAAHSPDGERFAAVSMDSALRLWDVRDGSLLAWSPGRGASALAFTADGSGVVVADADGTVTELDGYTLLPTDRSLDVGGEPAGIRTASTGMLAVMTRPRLRDREEIVFADLDERRVVRRVDPPFAVGFSSFSPDGSALAIGGLDGRLGIIDVASGAFIGPEDPVHSGPVAAVAFSPDGETLASLGGDGELVLVDAATAAPRARIQPGPINLLASVGFHPDGDSVLLAYEDGSAIEVATDPDMWIEHACRVAGRNLTETEWRDAFGDRPFHETCPTSDGP
jgi:WD40 repeat protein